MKIRLAFRFYSQSTTHVVANDARGRLFDQDGAVRETASCDSLRARLARVPPRSRESRETHSRKRPGRIKLLRRAIVLLGMPRLADFLSILLCGGTHRYYTAGIKQVAIHAHARDRIFARRKCPRCADVRCTIYNEITRCSLSYRHYYCLKLLPSGARGIRAVLIRRGAQTKNRVARPDESGIPRIVKLGFYLSSCSFLATFFFLRLAQHARSPPARLCVNLASTSIPLRSGTSVYAPLRTRARFPVIFHLVSRSHRA